MASWKRSFSNVTDMSTLQKEWDEASCPICMDHPHNAVLILCTSHEKGCRSFICDTSYRHSNCLDRFKQTKQENTETLPATASHESIDSSARSSGFEEHNPEEQVTLRCPLCRGNVLGWEVVADARRYLNLKPRSCSCESCCFSGNYGELRRHARTEHPRARPADADPSRQREWCRMEDLRELNDIVSAIRSAMPGAILVGDYAIAGGDRVFGSAGSGTERGRLLSTLFLFQMIGSLEGDGRRSRHRNLWGENLLGIQDEEDEDDEPDLNVPSDLGDDRRRRRWRRLSREQSDEERQ